MMDIEDKELKTLNKEYERLKTIGFIQTIFIILKLLNEVDWSWSAVFLPITLKLIYETVLTLIIAPIVMSEQENDN